MDQMPQSLGLAESSAYSPTQLDNGNNWSSPLNDTRKAFLWGMTSLHACLWFVVAKGYDYYPRPDIDLAITHKS